MVGTTDRTMTQGDLEPGATYWGRQDSNWTSGTRIIVSMAGGNVSYRPLTFEKGRGKIFAVRNRIFTCTTEAFLRWAIRKVEEARPAC